MSFTFNLKKRPNGKFSLRMRSYAIEDRLEAGKPDVEYIEKTLPEHEWARYGFKTTMTYEEASKLSKKLNATTRARDLAERKARFKYVENEQKKEMLKCAYLPEYIVTAFEKKLENETRFSGEFKKSKTYFHWKTAMKVIAEIEVDPLEWAENKRSVLKKLEGYAPSTIAKIISFMNRYGSFYSKRLSKYFEPLVKPKGMDLSTLTDKYLDKTGGRTKEGMGVTLEDMAKIKNSDLSEAEINWCIVSLGLALRPIEANSIYNPKFATLKESSVIIYQSKLITIPRNERYKEVKIKHPFQVEAFEILKKGKELKQPSVYMLRKILGDKYHRYSFRKGYEEIMYSLGEPIERSSRDMGHRSIERTWKSYRKRISAD